MSIQVVAGNSAEMRREKAAKRLRRKHQQLAHQHSLEVKQLAGDVAAAVKRSKHSVVYADSEELLLQILGIELGIIEIFPSIEEAEVHARKVDSRTGRSKFRQGDRQSLLREAINFCITTGDVCRHTDDDSERTSLYLAQNRPPKWTVIFAEGQQAVDNYIPTKRDLVIAELVNSYNGAHDGQFDMTPHPGRMNVLLRSWNQQFN